MRRFVFDIETAGLGSAQSPPQQILAGWYDGKTYGEHWGEACTEKAIEDILTQGEDCEIWAHFGGGFDFRFAMQWLIANCGKMEWLTQGSLILQIRGKYRGVKFALNDSIRLLPDSLEKIGLALGHEKLVVKYAHDAQCDIEPCVLCLSETQAGKMRLSAYWRRDLEILWQGIHSAENMLARVGVSKMRVTLASNASSALIERAGEPVTPWGKGGARDIDAEAEQAYCGGRVEVFRTNGVNVREYDIRSSYPAACVLDGPLPWRYKRGGGSTGWRASSLGVVNARVVVEPCHVPMLPFRTKDKLFFPTGAWRGTFTNCELRAAMAAGKARVVHVYWFHEWEGTDEIGAFMREAWEQRAATTGFESFFWKILLNSAYGKLIESREKERVVVNPESLEGMTPFRPGSPVYHAPVYRQPRLRCAAAGAYVTARARIRLWRFLEACGSDLLYCDTDSVFVAGCVLPTGPNLGDLKLESEYASAEFFAPKMYIADGKLRAKGLPGVTAAELRGLIAGEKYTFERTLGAREMYRSETMGYARKVVSKRHLGGRPKRCLLGNGETRPWTVSELGAKWPLDKQLKLWEK